MELVKNQKVKYPNTGPHYIVSLSFMEGDADGNQIQKYRFEEDEIEALKKFILAIEKSLKIRYYEDFNENMPEYNAFFKEECIRFGEERWFEVKYSPSKEEYFKKKAEEYAELNPKGIHIEWPMDCNYQYTSLDSYFVTYFDKDFNEFDVNVVFNEDEKKYIDNVECKKKSTKQIR